MDFTQREVAKGLGIGPAREVRQRADMNSASATDCGSPMARVLTSAHSPPMSGTMAPSTLDHPLGRNRRDQDSP